ncbi:MAG: CHAD domain-containing protein [Chloroflexota bacterium]
MTGPTRDLDVYLLHFDDLRAHLPEYLRDRLDPLYDHLVQRQRKEHNILVKALDTTRYAHLKQDWPVFLNQPIPPEEVPEAAKKSTLLVANQQILRTYRHAARDAAAITDASPSEQVHDLRKQAKKLRYLMEFFSSLYPKEDLKALVAELKLLQDVLGEYQDLQVQIESLETYASEMQAAGEAPADTLVAIGALTGQLYNRELQVRIEMMPRLKQFARPKLRRQFAKLFAPPRKGKPGTTEDA